MMTSKELVELCETTDTCTKCQYGKVCEAYQTHKFNSQILLFSPFCSYERRKNQC